MGCGGAAPRDDKPGREIDGRGGRRDDPGGGCRRRRPDQLRGVREVDDGQVIAAPLQLRRCSAARLLAAEVTNSLAGRPRGFRYEGRSSRLENSLGRLWAAHGSWI